MGYLNSVSIAQHVHRNLVMQLQSGRDGPGVNLPEQELRKDQPFSVADPRWRVYLDNYDLLERVEAIRCPEIVGTTAPEVKSLLEEYQRWEVPRNAKKSCKLKFKERRWTVGKERPSLKKASYASTSLRPSTFVNKSVCLSGSCK